MAKVKICGLKRKEDIEMVNKYLPDYCGFIINFSKSHRNKTPDEVRQLVKGLNRDKITPVGVFVDSPVEEVASLLNDNTIEIAQLHGSEDEEYIRKLREITDKKIMKAFMINDANDFAKALKSSADYLLIDKGQGSGESFDWSIIGGSDAKISRKWFLAGGLNEDNIRRAIEELAPFGVDLSSAVETDKIKDPEKVSRIIEIVRSI